MLSGGAQAYLESKCLPGKGSLCTVPFLGTQTDALEVRKAALGQHEGLAGV